MGIDNYGILGERKLGFAMERIEDWWLLEDLDGQSGFEISGFSYWEV